MNSSIGGLGGIGAGINTTKIGNTKGGGSFGIGAMTGGIQNSQSKNNMGSKGFTNTKIK